MIEIIKFVEAEDSQLAKLLEGMSKAVTLPALILAALSFCRLLTVKLVEEMLNQRGQAAEAEEFHCPECGSKLESKGLFPRTMLTLMGQVSWRRRVRRCPKGCKIGQVVPSDEALGLSPYQKTSDELKRVGCALAVFVPYAIAEQLLFLLCGVKVDNKTIWNWVQERGRLAMDQVATELAALEQGIEPELENMGKLLGLLPMLIGADGVMVPFRPNGGSPTGKTNWREVKVGILARLGQRVSGANKLFRRRLVAVLGTVEEFGPRLWLEAVRQGVKSADCVVWLSDGGTGFWGIYRTYFSSARGVLDFYHTSQYLWKGAKAYLDGRSTLAKQWFQQTRQLLKQGKLDLILDKIELACAQADLSPKAQKTLTNLYHYLETHQDHLDFPTCDKLGIPKGSGMVESACKWLIQQRFKGCGMRWSEDGFNHLLHLRLAWVNGRFDDLFLLP